MQKISQLIFPAAARFIEDRQTLFFGTKYEGEYSAEVIFLATFRDREKLEIKTVKHRLKVHDDQKKGH